jgi:hypothetical protein
VNDSSQPAHPVDVTVDDSESSTSENSEPDKHNTLDSDIEDKESVTNDDDDRNEIELEDEHVGIETDIGHFPDNPTTQQVETLVKIGPQPLPHSVEVDKKNRPFPLAVFYKTLPNGEVTSRDWLAFSTSKCSFYCYPCRLYYSELSKTVKTPSSFSQSSGRDKEIGWINMKVRAQEHENSTSHKEYYLKWRELESRLKNSQGVDSLLTAQMKSEVNFWRMLLQRILDVVMTLAERGLAFLGDNCHIDDVHNGNFLGLIELLSHYDTLLQEHVNKIREAQSSGKQVKVHYLSPQSQNEFIKLCGNAVRDKVLQERMAAKYYSILVDATPDVSHDEQNTFILRHLVLKNDVYSIQERFLEFVDETTHTGLGLSEMILNRLDVHSIPIQDCRGQGYDNASNMSGRFNGVQQHIKEVNPLCTYSPCGNHSLNLIGTDAVKSTVEFITFFGTVQAIYVLFSSSPRRWKILEDHIACSLHKMSGNYNTLL